MLIQPVYPILDVSTLEKRKGELASVVMMWKRLHLYYYQLRAKNFEENEYIEKAKFLKKLIPDMGIIANDFVHAALQESSLFSGIHVGQEDFAALNTDLIKDLENKSRNHPDYKTGISNHSLADLIRSCSYYIEGKGIAWNYLALGPFFQTASKQDHSPLLTTDEVEQCLSFLSEKIFTCRKDRKPDIVFIGGFHYEGTKKLLGKNFYQKRGFFPSIAMISGALELSSLSGMIHLLSDYNA